MNCFPDNF